MPYKEISSSIATAASGFYVAGTSSEDWFGSPPFDFWGSYSLPYFILSPRQNTRKIILLPEFEQTVSWGLGGHGNTIVTSSALATNDTLFVAWSNIKEHYGDIMPVVVFESTYVRVAKNVHDSLTTLLTIPSALRPALAADHDDAVHVVWEDVTPLDSQWNSYFFKYSSTVVYQRRSAGGGFSVPIEIGKGFFPSVNVKNSTVSVLYFGADSSNQNVFFLRFSKKEGDKFTEPVTLCTIASDLPVLWDISYYIRYVNVRWNVDSNGAIHIAWCDPFGTKKTYVIHHRKEVGTQIDSLDDLNACIRFMNDGAVKILSAKQVDGTDSLRVLTLLSQQGNPLQTVHAATFHLQGSLSQMLVDKDSNDHVIVTDGTRSSIIKHASTDSAKPILLSAGYTINPGSFVDSANRVWLTGKRDSTPVLLNFSLDDVGTHEDFVFPLRMGNQWHYLVYETEGSGPDFFPDKNIHKVVGDTVMSNEKKYAIVTSSMFSPRYYRKDGLKIYQYNTKNNKEYVRFDFTKSTGDTISRYDTVGTNSIWIGSTDERFFFGRTRKTFGFLGGLLHPNMHEFSYLVSDSIGIVLFSDGLSYSSEIVGAVLNGATYGMLLSVNGAHDRLPSAFSLSQNYPNPFNPSTTIEYQLPRVALVTIIIYDLLGREVAVLVNEEMNAGVHNATWDASHFSSGMYFARMTAGQFTSTKKLLLMK